MDATRLSRRGFIVGASGLALTAALRPAPTLAARPPIAKYTVPILTMGSVGAFTFTELQDFSTTTFTQTITVIDPKTGKITQQQVTLTVPDAELVGALTQGERDTLANMHAMAEAGLPQSKVDAQLALYLPHVAQPVRVYLLKDAFVAAVGMKRVGKTVATKVVIGYTQRTVQQ